MGAFKTAVITDNGNTMIAKAIANLKQIKFSKVVVSSHEYPDETTWSSMTEIEDIKQETTPTDVRISGTSQINLRALFTNTDVMEKFSIQLIGIYATDGDQEVLLAVSKAVTPDEMPAYVGAAPSSFIYNINLYVSRASAVQTTVDPAGTATVQDILGIRADIEKVNAKVEKVLRDVIVTVPTTWTGETAPYTQIISVPGIKVGDPAELWSAITADTSAADVKTWTKMAAMINAAEISTDGKLTLICRLKKPTAEFKVRLKGVSGT